MTELQRYSRYAEKKLGTNNKFYEVEAIEESSERSTWTFRWGRIGTTGQSKEGSTITYSLAYACCQRQFESKLSKGYREVTAMQALASAVEDPSERKINGLSSVEIDIPNFHAGRSEKRCREFCTKWLQKLNIVRNSKWGLGDDYTKQIEAALHGYCKEWARIRSSKTHGENLDAAADTAFRIFFGALKDNSGTYTSGYYTGIGVR